MKKFELSIPKPCHENWDAMTPAEQGRFCDACQKTVIDFSNMSDHQIAQFFKKPAGSMCGRFHADQLDRTIEMPTKRIPWLKYFFTISLPAFLFSLRSNAQKEMIGKIAVTKENQWIDTTVSAPVTIKNKPALKGRVAIQKPVRMKIEEIKTEGSVLANKNVCVLPKFKPVEESTASIANAMMMVGMVVYSPSAQVTKGEAAKLMPSKNHDAGFVNFSVYPNPVVSGGLVTVQSIMMKEGIYEYSILTSTGEVVQNGEVSVMGQTKQVSINVLRLPPAAYFLRLTNKQTKKNYTEIMVVQ